MRAYTIRPAKGLKREDDAEPIKARFAGSQTDASTEKKAMIEKFGLKRTDVVIDQVDIPTSKGDLIPWLNKTFG